MATDITILAIETSCDETATAVISKQSDKVITLSSAVASQIDIHKETGGVVPEVAAREHVTAIRPLIQKVMAEAKVTGTDMDAIAVTIGPGLMPALSVGVQAARTLSFAWNKPIVPVHHIEGHIYSALLGEETSFSENIFPALALIVSGGHTLLVHIEKNLEYRIIGTTRDDAAGEVFDKVGRMLSLPYPGGPHVSKLAESGNDSAITFPRPMIHSNDLDFSFSGLKTAVLYALREMKEDEAEARKADVAASFEAAVIDSLITKTKAALAQKSYQTLLLAGGVAANKRLRQEMKKASQETNTPLKIAPLALCGDNAVMIGQVGVLALEAGRQEEWKNIDPVARVDIESFSGPLYSG